MRRILPLVLALLGGCGLLGGNSLEPTAKKYYDFMVGRSGNHSFSTFISPAFKAQISAEDLQNMDRQQGSGKVNTRFQPIKLEDVAVSVDGKYGLSKANPKLGGTYSRMEPLRWVRVGKKWYLYLNSDAEVSAYGLFPENLPQPQFLPPPPKEE